MSASPEIGEEAAAAEERHVGALLVLERDDVDAHRMRLVRLDGAARDFERVADAERAVEPSALGDRVGVRADQDRAGGAAIGSEHVADPVHGRGKAGGFELADQPAPRRDVFRRQGDPVHAGLVGPDAGQLPQIGEQPFAVDAYHSEPRDARLPKHVRAAKSIRLSTQAWGSIGPAGRSTGVEANGEEHGRCL